MELTRTERRALRAKLEAELRRRDGIQVGSEEAERSLLAFARLFWHVLEPPRRVFVTGWVIEAIAEHLEAVTRGDINRLLINVPPGFTKSLMTDVFWPAWEWGPQNLPTHRFLCFSYSGALTVRDNGRFRRLVMSQEYRELWGERFELTAEAVLKVENDKNGWKLATSVGGIGTGERGDRVIIDDPNNVKKSESKKVIEDTNQWLTEVVPDRLNDQAESAIVLIQQRTNQRDCSGTLLDPEIAGDYCHLSIPNEYEPRRYYTNPLGWSDPRTEEGELAWPERLSAEETAKLKRIKGSFAYAGQYQQSPAPRGGGIIRRDDWQVWPIGGEDLDEGGQPLRPLEYPPFDYIVASLDTALTENEENDWSALTVWGSWRDANGTPKLMLMEAWQVRLAFYPLVQRIIKTCKKRQIDRLLVEAKANGISVAQEIMRLVEAEEFGVTLIDPRKAGGDKVARAYAVQHLFENGAVFAPERAWSEIVIDECAVFPKGVHDDLVDTVTQALWFLRKSRVALLSEERAAEDMRAAMRPPGISRPKSSVAEDYGV